jgi:protein-S-isoprenylcysteine O-methyltransferase Ste14
MDGNPYASPSPTPDAPNRMRRIVGIALYVVAALLLINSVALAILVNQLATRFKVPVSAILVEVLVKAAIGLGLIWWGRYLRRPDVPNKNS